MSFGEAIKWGLTPGAYTKVLERAHVIAAWAPQNGLTYNWEDPYNLATFPFAFFNETFKLHTFNVVSGNWKGTEVYLFDYQGNDKDGNGSGGWDDFPTMRTCVMVPIPGAVPAFLAAGKHSRWTPWRFPKEWGFQKFESGDPAFDDTFKCWSTIPDYAKWIVNDPTMRQWLVSRGKGFSIEMNQMNMLLIQGLAEPEYLPSLLDFAIGLPPLVPKQIWEWYPRPTA